MKIFEYSIRATKEVLSELDVNQDSGLSLDSLSDREAKYGLNKFNLKSVSAWNIFFRQFKSAFIYLLVGAIILTLFLGETTDALMIFLFFLFSLKCGRKCCRQIGLSPVF